MTCGPFTTEYTVRWVTSTTGAENREVTFTGRIEGYEKRKVEGYVYDFPRVAADVIYLWPKRERVDVVTRPSPWPWAWGW